jgi:hypothetical protein
MLCQGGLLGPSASSGTMRRSRRTHIFPGCWRQSSTARSESIERPALTNSAQARRMVAAWRKGLVGRSSAKQSAPRPAASSAPSVWRTHSMSGERSPAIEAGRRNGTSAPYCRARSAVASESVETITAAKTPLSRAAAMV